MEHICPDSCERLVFLFLCTKWRSLGEKGKRHSEESLKGTSGGLLANLPTIFHTFGIWSKYFQKISSILLSLKETTSHTFWSKYFQEILVKRLHIKSIVDNTLAKTMCSLPPQGFYLTQKQWNSGGNIFCKIRSVPRQPIICMYTEED